MKVLVTGATGFVGAHCCESLTQLGHNTLGLARNEEKFHKKKIKAELIKGNLEDLSWIEQLPPNLNAVVHIAGMLFTFDSQVFYRINTATTIEMVKRLKDRYRNLNFIFISSIAAAGPSESGIPKNEENEDRPISDYGKSKLKAEHELARILPQSWVKSIIRPPIVLGPGDENMLDVFKMAKKGIIATLGNRPTSYSFVSVFDLIQTIQLCLERTDQRLETYYSSHPEVVSHHHFMETMAKLQGTSKRIHLSIPEIVVKGAAQASKLAHKLLRKSFSLTPDKAVEVLAGSWVCSSAKATSKLNQTFEDDLHMTLKKTIHDYRQRNWL